MTVFSSMLPMWCCCAGGADGNEEHDKLTESKGISNSGKKDSEKVTAVDLPVGFTPPGDGSRENANIRSYTLEELRLATKNFATRIGEGGFGPVYKGFVRIPPDTQQWIAIKKLSSTSGQGIPELVKEIEVLPRLHHRHLVKLLGYCSENECQALVYEYISNGTLKDHLHGKKGEDTLPWAKRIDILMDIAHAISYLHIHVQPAVIHRDIKTANILLDEKLRAKLADFGLSKLLSGDDEYTHITTDVKGTAGYLDPEYYRTRQLTDKSDVYSFGVVLLEVLSGRRPIEFTPRNHFNLVNWARSELEKGNLDHVLDKRILAGVYCEEAAWKLAECAMQCCEPYSQNRPSMNVVTRDIEEARYIQRRGPEVQRPVPVENPAEDGNEK